ncbi:Glycosyltransferase [hydrothermal vent metagenome]|uniref:Glycosyltransferase n=1 Tax=hydrothermal vent metagenome TaxID=652676 RepID=A0A1W1C1A6_9ZZZZ
MKIYYVKHNTTRSKEFQLSTIIYEDNGVKYVKKEAFCEEAIPHLKKMESSYISLSKSIRNPKVKLAKIISRTENSLTFEFINGISFEDKFHNSLDKSKIVKEYKSFLYDNFRFDEVANIDLIFSNIIFKDDIAYIIDYEWVFSDNIDIEYIFFRAIKNLDNINILKENFLEDKILRYEERENSFIFDYALNKESFFQTQHNYLKNKIDPFKKIEELEGDISNKNNQLRDFEKLVIYKENINEKQAEYIDSLTMQIGELKDIAQSLRIKNRIKSVLPQFLIKAIQKIKKKTVISNIVSSEIDTSSNIETINLKDYFVDFDIERYKIDISIDIIIPVYNGYEFLESLFDSLERNTQSSAHRLIVINDCSPDDRVKPYLLDRLKKHNNHIFIDHKVNLGFVKSVNEGYSHTKNHFLILNTDTEVPPFWLERVMYPILNMDKIASTTPFTNSGEIASFPNFIADNNIFDDMTVDDLDKAFQNVNADNFYAEVPTGVGFCMGVNYNLIKEIGFFIEKDFGKGYGEENDWCQRSIVAGYKNLIVPNLFVYHKHGGSFTAEQKKALIKENSKKLLKRYPNYDRDVQDYIKLNPHKDLRKLLVILSSQDIYFIIDHGLGGGANDYTTKLLDNYKENNKRVLKLIYNYHKKIYQLYFDYKDYHFNFNIVNFDEVQEFINRLDIKEIFLNSTVSFKMPYSILEWIEELKTITKANLILPIHDFYPVCPNYTLLNEKDEYCEVPDNLDICQKCMSNNDFEAKVFLDSDIDIAIWREKWGKIVTSSDKILCFSKSSKDILLKAYKDIETNKIEVIPHKAQYHLDPIELEERDDNITTIGVLGSINKAKGADIIKELVDRIDKENLDIKVVLIGEISTPITSPNFVKTGRYKRDRLPSLIKNHKIDIFLIPSIWAETFSYTTQEIMMMDMPIMVFNIGAPAERVKDYTKGIVLEKDYITNILEHIKK